MIKGMLKAVVPPLCIGVYHRLRQSGFYGIAGDFADWEEAEAYLRRRGEGGYTSQKILDRVLESIQKVRHGEAVFERDGVVFDKPEYNYPLLAALLYCINQSKSKDAHGRTNVHIMDFGGSLGSTYFQNRMYLASVEPYTWHICEQPQFVATGKQEIPEIHFHESVQAYADTGNQKNILLLSGVIQYFDHPYQWLNMLLGQSFVYIIIDRAFFNIEEKDRLSIQYVPPEIYDAAYPVWLLGRQKFLRTFETAGYELLDQWDSFDCMPVRECWGMHRALRSEGMLFRLSPAHKG